ncbi:hypothetical protein [Bradyrhizobium lupini]|uniref:hypothetical protein n=1 Tax=Rhizobium lupini TaxID=136996 RepID=UPI0034C626F0
MWQGIQRRFYFMMYYFGRTPPTSAEIDAAFEKIETEATIAADDPWCDCLVKAGPTVIECKTRRTSTCEAMGQLRPDVNASPHTSASAKACRMARNEQGCASLQSLALDLAFIGYPVRMCVGRPQFRYTGGSLRTDHPFDVAARELRTGAVDRAG